MNAAFLGLVTWAVFGVGVLTAERVLGGTATAALLGGLLCAGALWGAILLGGGRVSRALGAVAARLDLVSERAWVVSCLALGTVLRAAWVAVLPPVQCSDMTIYFGLARSLAERGTFAWGTDRVYMPPGLPLLLAPFVKLFGPAAWLPFALNLVLAAGTVLVVAALARLLANARGLRPATLLVAVWPNHVMLSGLASKELLVLFLLPFATLLYLKGTESPGGRPWRSGAFPAGLVLGAATLAQPNILVLLPAFAALEALRRTPARAAAGRLGLLAAGIVLVVAPWTVRNGLLFGRFVPVSANFGHSLWVGNHPGADGGFQPIRDPYVGMNEIEYDRMARRKALAWIAASPRTFLALAPRKQMLFLGDDADGPYHALKWAHGISDWRYVAAKGACSAFWLGVLALAGIALYRGRLDPLFSDPRLVFLSLFWFCLLALLSVTESGARHHVALSGFLALLAGLALPGRRAAGPPTDAGV